MGEQCYKEWMGRCGHAHSIQKNYLFEQSLSTEIKQAFSEQFVEFALKDNIVKKKALMPLIELYICKHLRQTFGILNVSVMVKGHDPQQNGKVGVYCDESLFLIDVGLSKAYGANIGAIEIDLLNNNKVQIVN